MIGYWADRNDMNLYNFDGKGDFEYYVKAMNAGDNVLSGREGNPPSYKVWKGVYSHGKDKCRSNQQKGNLMIYVDEMQCCMMTQGIAGKLVLTEIFSKGHEGMSICKDRVLTRIKVLPRAQEE
ncbi:MAG: hypothetical protein FIA93_02020 [Deltaproteobacteria bacterium]|nr:hypothetical protein [Deltaproteobacteria bacterium]